MVDYAVGEIRICTRIENEDCNDGTFTLDLTPHKLSSSGQSLQVCHFGIYGIE